jgi:uncharacterized protein (DUF1778 family)
VHGVIVRDKPKPDSASFVLTTDIHLLSITASISPILKEKPMRDAAINLRARPVQRDLIDQAAQLLGKSRSDFMLEAACDKARSVLLDQVFFGLDDARFQSFVQMLDAPVAPNEGLQRLMDVKPVWQTP